MTTMQYRTSLGSYYTENRTYNNRAQTVEIQAGVPGLPGFGVLDLRYAYNTGMNNGQVAQTTDANSGEQVTYQYDSLKRLIQARTAGPGYGQSFGYDGWGNLVSKTPLREHTGTAMSLSVDPSTNHVTTSGSGYDANGNTTSLPSSTQNITLSYDMMNRTGGTWFDQQNQPLDRAGVWNLYGLGGERLGTYAYTTSTQQYTYPNLVIVVTTAPETRMSRNIYFGGRLIQSNGSTVLTDRMGSVRTNEAGAGSEYLPYGEEVSGTANDREKFATYTKGTQFVVASSSIPKFKVLFPDAQQRSY